MMHGCEKSDLVIGAMNPANKARKARCGGICGGGRSGVVERRAGAKGNTHQQSTCRAQNRISVTQALERIRQLLPSHTRGRSRMRESRTYGSGRGACHEMHVPTATTARVHHAARRRGGCVAARGAGAAAGADTACGRAHACDFGRAGIAGPDRGICARAAGSGVVRRPQRTHRDPLEHWRCLAPAQGCGRTSRARPGRCAGWSWRNDSSVARGEPHGARSVRPRPRSGWCWLCRESGRDRAEMQPALLNSNTV